MKRLIGAVMAVVLLVSVAPVLAGDSFYALSRLPAGLSPLDDAQLPTVEGGQTAVDVCPNPPGCLSLNIAVVPSINVGVQTAVALFNVGINLEQLLDQAITVDAVQDIN